MNKGSVRRYCSGTTSALIAAQQEQAVAAVGVTVTFRLDGQVDGRQPLYRVLGYPSGDERTGRTRGPPGDPRDGRASGTSAGSRRSRRRRPFEDPEHANDHFAHIYETRAEQLAVAVPFLREGLEGGEQCICVVDETADEERVITRALEADGVDVAAARAAGDLVIYSAQETYLRTDPFNPAEMISLYADLIENAREEYDGLRVTAGTRWLEEIDIAAFMEYEGRVNKLFREADARALCQYNRTRLPPAVIRDVLRTHPHLIFEDAVCENVYYIPPDELFGPEQPEREVERMGGR